MAALQMGFRGWPGPAASLSSRSAVPWRRACHIPYFAKSPLDTSSSFLRGGATKPLEVWGA